jgi:hypothetical protein
MYLLFEITQMEALLEMRGERAAGKAQDQILMA